jgi:hypothetical protein
VIHRAASTPRYPAAVVCWIWIALASARALYGADCNDNGFEDAQEIALDADCNDNGVPDSCDIAPRVGADGSYEIRLSHRPFPLSFVIDDFDGVERNDLLVGDSNYTVRLVPDLDSVAARSPPSAPLIDVGGPALASIAADFDLDGDLDILGGEKILSGFVREDIRFGLIVHLGDGGFETLRTDYPSSGSLITADVNNDGLLDVLGFDV